MCAFSFAWAICSLTYSLCFGIPLVIFVFLLLILPGANCSLEVQHAVFV